MTKKTKATRKKRPGKAVQSMAALEKQMAVHATGAKARINQPAGINIGIRNGKFTYKQEVIGRTLRVCVINFVHTNAWYDTLFDPESPTPPACFAMSDDGLDMAPEDVSPDRQSDVCNGCKQNAWGSADIGRGKACKNQYRLACIAPAKDEDASETEIAVLTLPPTSLKNWDHYVRGLEDQLNRPPYGVITEFTFDEGEEWPVLTPVVDKVITDPELLTKLINRVDEAQTMLMEPFDVSGYQAPTAAQKKAAKKKKITKKKASKKRATKKKKTKKKASKKNPRSSKFS